MKAKLPSPANTHAPRRSRPPIAATRPETRVVHGETLSDDYGWMRADNWKEVLRNPDALPADIQSHLLAENAYAKTLMAPTRALQRTVLREMRGRIREDDTSVPKRDGAFLYYQRYRRGGEHPLVCRKPLIPAKGRNGGEQIMLDADALARGKDFFDLGEVLHAPCHKLLAWSADEQGSELYAIRIRDIASGEDLVDIVPDTTGELVWANDSRSFCYVRLDADHRPSIVMRHRLGTEVSTDEVLHAEADDGMFVHINETQSGRFLLINIGDHETSEVRLLDLDAPDLPARIVEPRHVGRRYDVDHHGDDLVILTNADGAEDFKIITVPHSAPGHPNWRDLVPHRSGAMILSHVCFAGRLVRMERENGLARIIIRELATGHEHAIGFDNEAYGLGMSAGHEFSTDMLRFTWSSFAHPAETYDYNMATGERVLMKRQQIPSGHDPEAYEVRRIFAPASDGEMVPVSLLYRRGLKLDGSPPCLLYAYGSYGIAMSASFRSGPLSLVDRGFVYAIAHVRGGTDKGWRWYQDGKVHKKPNTFTDFIAAGEMLARDGYTSRGRIVAQGGSAGGMLMGAIANLAPDLFAGIIAEVAFVDVLNTILDDTLPLTPPEWPEWGDPIRDKAAFDTIKSYSPYDNIKAQSYPPILALAGLTDPRVTYWEPAKWVAKLRATMAGGGPVMLQTNMDAGHGGSAGRFDRLKEVALAYAFAIHCAGDGFGKPLGQGAKGT